VRIFSLLVVPFVWGRDEKSRPAGETFLLYGLPAQVKEKEAPDRAARPGRPANPAGKSLDFLEAIC